MRETGAVPTTEMDGAWTVLDRLAPDGCRVALLVEPELSGALEPLEVEVSVAAAELPGFPPPSQHLEKVQLLVGRWAGWRVAAFCGSFDRAGNQLTLPHAVMPIRLMARMGADVLVLIVNGLGLDPGWKSGDLVLIDDHINLTGRNPLMGPNPDHYGPRFPDMTAAYDGDLAALVEAAAMKSRLPLRRGIYGAMPGSIPPTPAECRMLHRLGANVAGCGLVHEVIVARHIGLPVAAMAALAYEVGSHLCEGHAHPECEPSLENAGKSLSLVIDGLLNDLNSVIA